MCPFHLQTLLNAFYTNSSSLSIMNYPSPRTLIDCFSIPSLSYSTIWQNSSKRLYQDLDCVFFLSDILLLSGSLDCSRIKGKHFCFPSNSFIIHNFGPQVRVVGDFHRPEIMDVTEPVEQVNEPTLPLPQEVTAPLLPEKPQEDSDANASVGASIINMTNNVLGSGLVALAYSMKQVQNI